MATFMSRLVEVPSLVSGKMLGDYAHGDIVLLNESGSPVEFYVAEHAYMQGLNGNGGTLLVRKNVYDTRAWNSTQINTWAGSAFDTWLNGNYKALLDAEVQAAILPTYFQYTPGNANMSVTTLNRAIFQLSLTELGKSGTNANAEGSALPIASMLQVAYMNGSVITQWTRTPDTAGKVNSWCLNNSGNPVSTLSSGKLGSRPVFCLPSTTMFDPTTNTFLKVG